MRTSSTNPRSAATAIAAVLALLAIPALAQEASAPPLGGPIVDAQPPATTTAVPIVPAAEPAPTLVIPDASVVDEPVRAAQAAPPTRRSAPEPQAVAPARSTTALRQAAPAASAPIAADAPEAVDDEPPAATGEGLLPPAMVEENRPPSLDASEEETSGINAVLALVLVAMLGLVAGIFTLAALRRRGPAARRKAAAAAAPTREPAPHPVASVGEPAPLTDPVPVLGRAPARPLRSAGAAVPLPARVPETYEERDALLKRMLDAPPDRANPFTDRRARLRRARLILQSLGRRFDHAKPWIDFSDYPENWPALARRAPAPSAPARTRELEPA